MTAPADLDAELAAELAAYDAIRAAQAAAAAAIRVDRAAKVLYETYRSDGYAPKWDAATPNRAQWRKAAAALLESVEDGRI